VRGIVREQGSSFSVSEGSCHPWAIAVRGWVGSLSMSAGSVSGEGGSSSVSGRSSQSVGGRRSPWAVFVRGRSWFTSGGRPYGVAGAGGGGLGSSFVGGGRPSTGGNRRPSMEGVVVLRKWGEGSPLSVRARPPWAVVVLRWGASPYVGGQRSWMGGGPSTSVVVPIGGGRCRRRPLSLSPRVKGWAWSCALVLCKWVSGFERGRREHTIDGTIAIDRVHGAPCGGGAFVPLASCCSLSSLSSFLRCVVLEIGCGGVSFGVLRIAVDVARPLACHVSGLVVVRCVEHHHRYVVVVVVAVGVVDGGGVGVLVVGGGG
jgi:hypothetical protein